MISLAIASFSTILTAATEPEVPQYADARAVSLTLPVYPRKALVEGIEGEVRTCFTITAKGDVRKPRIMRSSHRMFEKPVKRAAKESRFEPKIWDGKPTDSNFCRTYHFTLDGLDLSL